MAAKSVDEYVAGLDGWQAQTVTRLRRLIREVAPEAVESFKWAQPVYESNGPFCYIKAFKSSVNFGFWRGVDLSDGGAVLEGSGDKMRHVKLTGPDDVDEELFKDFVRQAVHLNEEKGDPSRAK